MDAPAGSRLGTPPVVSDYGLVHLCMNTGIREIRDTPALQVLRQEYMWFLKHVSKRRYSLVFTSCPDPECKCPGQPGDWELDFMKELKLLGGTLPSPAPSEKDPTHYMTLKDHLELDPSAARASADQHCPSRISKSLTLCHHCRSYVFTSKTNESNHMSLVHGNESNGPPHFEKYLPSFQCADCDVLIPDAWWAARHKKYEKHKVSSSAPAHKELNWRVKRGRFSQPEQPTASGDRKALPVGDPLVPQQPAPAKLRAKRPRAQTECVRGRRSVEGAEDGDEGQDAPPAKRSRRRMKKRREKVDGEESSEKSEESSKEETSGPEEDSEEEESESEHCDRGESGERESSEGENAGDDVPLRFLRPSVESEPGPRAEGLILPCDKDLADPDFLVGKEVWYKYGLQYDQCERLRGGWRKGTVQRNKQKRLGWRLQIVHPAVKAVGRAVTILAEFDKDKHITEQGPDADGTWALAVPKQAKSTQQKRCRVNP